MPRQKITRAGQTAQTTDAQNARRIDWNQVVQERQAAASQKIDWNQVVSERQKQQDQLPQQLQRQRELWEAGQQRREQIHAVKRRDYEVQARRVERAARDYGRQQTQRVQDDPAYGVALNYTAKQLSDALSRFQAEGKSEADIERLKSALNRRREMDTNNEIYTADTNELRRQLAEAGRQERFYENALSERGYALEPYRKNFGTAYDTVQPAGASDYDETLPGWAEAKASYDEAQAQLERYRQRNAMLSGEIARREEEERLSRFAELEQKAAQDPARASRIEEGRRRYEEYNAEAERAYFDLNKTENGPEYNPAAERKWMEEADKETFYYLYATDPDAANEWAEYARTSNRDAYFARKQELAGLTPYNRIQALGAGTVSNLAAGPLWLLTLGDDDAMDVSRYGSAMLGGASQGLTERGLLNTGFGAGTLPENIPIVGGKGLGALYELGSSMIQSLAAAYIPGGPALLGLSAAASDYTQMLDNGYDAGTAMAHAAAAGIAEALFERVSLDKLVKQDFSSGVIRELLKQGGVEASEEICTTIANTLTDEAILGSESKRARRTRELMASGMTEDEASRKAASEWLSDLLYDGLAGFASGLGMTGGNVGVKSAVQSVNQSRAQRAINAAIGADVAGDAELANALNAEAQQRGMPQLDPAVLQRAQQAAQRTQAQQAAERAQAQTEATEEAADETEGGEQEKPVTRRQERETRREERKAQRDYRAVGKQASAIVESVSTEARQSLDGKTVAEAENALTEITKRSPRLAGAVESEAFEHSAKLYQGAGSLDKLNTRHADNVRGLKDAGLRAAAEAAYDEAADRFTENRDEAAKVRRQGRYASREGALDMSATYERGGETVKATVKDFAADGQRVVLDNGETVALDKVSLDPDAADVLGVLRSDDLGAAASDVLALYNEAADSGKISGSGYGYLMELRTAVGYGRNNTRTLAQTQAAVALDAETAKRAYEIGQEARKAKYSAKQAALDARKAAAARDGRQSAVPTEENESGAKDGGTENTSPTVQKSESKGVSGRKGSVDTTAVKGAKLNRKQRIQLAFASKIAEALGIDVVVTADNRTVKRGGLDVFVGRNGAYQGGKLYLDINAGRYSTISEASGILRAMSHELTHFIEDYSPELYEELKAFAFDLLGQQYGAAGFADLVNAKLARDSTGKLTEQEAEDEILADACETMLRDSEAVKEALAAHESLGDKLLDWLARFVARLREIFGDAAHEEARFVDSLDAQMRRVWQEKWDAALRDAVQTHGIVGNNAAEASEKASERDESELSREINESMTMQQARRMIDRAFVIGDVLNWYDGEYKNADEWLRGEGAYSIALVIDNDRTLYTSFVSRIKGIIEDNFTTEDILNAYLKGTLTGKEKTAARKLDTASGVVVSDSRFYAPKAIQNAIEVFETANQRVTKSNQAEVYAARANILLYAHNRGAASTLGLTQAELNKKLRSWSNYSATARETSERINRGVAAANRWTGIENSAYIVNAAVTTDDIRRMVKSVEGDGSGYDTRYIARTMLALDTHIDWSWLNIKFDTVQGVNKSGLKEYVNGKVMTCAGYYLDNNRLIHVKRTAPNTVAHEMGHALDHQWGRDIGLGYALSESFSNDSRVTGEVKIWFEHVHEFFDSLVESSDISSEYSGRRGETFARFVDRFVRWTEQIATGQQSREYDMYRDKFTAAQFVQFARLLQEKAAIDAKGLTGNKLTTDQGAKMSDRDTAERDAEYLSAVERGDMETAQRMVDEAARAAGYLYRRNTRRKLNAENGLSPIRMFVYDADGFAQLDGYGKNRYAATDAGAIRADDITDELLKLAREYFAENDMDASGLTEQSVNPTDIVSSAQMWDDADFVQYAWDNYFEAIYNRTGNTPALVTDDGLIVFGDDDRRIKSLDPVTYDDSGKPIPLPERFNPKNEDIRYSERDAEDMTDEELLMSFGQGAAQTDEQRRLVEDAQKTAARLTEYKRKYSELSRELRAADAENPHRLTVKDFRKNLLDLFGIPSGQRNDVGALMEEIANSVIGGYPMTNDELRGFFEYFLGLGKTEINAESDSAAIRDWLRGKRIYVDDVTRQDFTDNDYDALRRKAFGMGVYLTTDPADVSLDSAHMELGEMFGGNRFGADTYDGRTMLEDIVNAAEQGRTRTVSLSEAMRHTEQTEGISVQEQTEDLLDRYFRQYEMMLDKAALENRARRSGSAEALKAKQAAKETAQKLREKQKEIAALKGKVERRDAALAEEKALREAWKKKANRNADLIKAFTSSKNTDLGALERKLNAKYEGEKRAKNSALKKLEQQIEREQDILSGKLTPPGMQKILKDARIAAAAEVRERKDAQIERMREQRKIKEIKGRLVNLADTMRKQLLHPQQRRYVPQQFIGNVLDMFDLLNFGNSKKAQKDRLNIAALNAQYDELGESSGQKVFYDPVVKELMVDLSKRLDGRNINQLSHDDLQEVYRFVRALYTTIRNTVKADEIEKGKASYEIGYNMMQELRRNKGGLPRAAEYFLSLHLDARRMFNRFGGYVTDSYWNKTFEMLNNASHEALRLEMEATKIFEPLFDTKKQKEQAQSLADYSEKGLVDIGLKDEDGNAVKITHGMMLATYMLLLNEDSARHIMYGGLTMPDLKRYYGNKSEAWGRGQTRIAPTGARLFEIADEMDALDPSDLPRYLELDAQRQAAEQEARREIESIQSRIESKLTSYERAWVKAAQKFFDGFSKDAMNRTTMELYGFRKALVEHYFPIHTDSDFIGADWESIRRDLSLENMGITKERVKARNPILLEDLTRVIDRHIHDISRYAGLTKAIKTFKSIYNVQTQHHGDSLQKSLAQSSFGERGQKFVENLMADLNGARKQGATIFDRVKGKYAQAVLSANLSVTLKQTASYPAAAAVVGWKALGKAFLAGGKDQRLISRANRELIDIYTPLMWARDWGAVDSEIGEISNAKDWTKDVPWLMGWIKGADKITVGRLWSAAEYYVRDNYKGLQVGSNEDVEAGQSPFYQKVAEVFNRIVEETQPNYSVLQRPDILRNPNAIIRSLTMFMTQRLQNSQIVFDALAEYRAKTRFDKAGSTKQTRDERRAARVRLAHAVSSQIVSAMVLNAMTQGVAALLHRMNPYRDDDEELTGWSLFKAYMEGLLSTFSGTILGGQEIFNALNAIFSGEEYYGSDVGGVSVLSDVLDNIVKLGKGVGDALETEDGESAEKWASFAKGNYKRVIQSVGQLTGIPADNLYKIGEGIYRHVDDAMTTSFGSFESGVTRKTTTNVKRWIEAKTAGDERKASSVLDEMHRNYADAGKDEGTAEDEIAKEIHSRMKEAFKKGESVEALETMLEDIGISEDATAKWNKKTLGEMFRDGKLDEEEYRSYLGIYAGIEDEDKIDELVNNGQSYMEFGSAPSDINQAYRDGELDAEQAVEALTKYGGKSREEAEQRVAALDFSMEHGWELSDAEDYLFKVPAKGKQTKSAEQFGITPEEYAEYKEIVRNTKGTDVDGDGTTDSGSKKKAVLTALRQLGYSGQKLLWFANAAGYVDTETK